MTQTPLDIVPDDVAAERAIARHRDDRRRRLYALVRMLEKATKRDPAELMRTVTAYKDRNGKVVRGRLNPYLLSDEHLERSIADAEGWLDRLSREAE